MKLTLTLISAVLLSADAFAWGPHSEIAQAALDVSLSAVRSDSRRDLPLGDVNVARSQLLAAINGRPAAVRLQMGL
jgi:hypothetical protein